MRTGSLRLPASAVPGSRQISNTQSVTATPTRPFSRCCSPAGPPHGLWLGSLCIAAPTALPPPFGGLEIGVVILLEEEAVGEQRRRRGADQLDVGLRIGVPRGELLGREGRKGPTQQREHVQGFQIIRIEPPVDAQWGSRMRAVRQYGRHV